MLRQLDAQILIKIVLGYAKNLIYPSFEQKLSWALVRVHPGPLKILSSEGAKAEPKHS